MDKKLLENLLQNVENKDDIINQIYVEYGKEVNKLLKVKLYQSFRLYNNQFK